jgi:AcrR family transcriptional regulator
MERDWLEAQLAAGRSIESIAREVGANPSTVAYWASKFGLATAHAGRHRSRGGLAREELSVLVERGLSVRQIAAALDRSPTTVRHWLRRYALRTEPAGERIESSAGGSRSMRRCRRHGWSPFVRSASGHQRCLRCRSDAVTKRRRRVKAILVAEAGGRCLLCGYAHFAGALQFHHLDPNAKRFSLAAGGLAHSLDTARREAAKCVLLCANCHAEVEGGVATIALDGPADNLSKDADP